MSASVVGVAPGALVYTTWILDESGAVQPSTAVTTIDLQSMESVANVLVERMGGDPILLADGRTLVFRGPGTGTVASDLWHVDVGPGAASPPEVLGASGRRDAYERRNVDGSAVVYLNEQPWPADEVIVAMDPVAATAHTWAPNRPVGRLGPMMPTADGGVVVEVFGPNQDVETSDGELVYIAANGEVLSLGAKGTPLTILR